MSPITRTLFVIRKPVLIAMYSTSFQRHSSSKNKVFELVFIPETIKFVILENKVIQIKQETW